MVCSSPHFALKGLIRGSSAFREIVAEPFRTRDSEFPLRFPISLVIQLVTLFMN